MEGYIKDWRQELESDVWLMPPLYHRIWQWLKYTANHKDKYIPMHDGSKMLVKRGQKLTSIRSIAEGVGWYERGVFKKPNPKTVQDVLNWLAKNGMITIDTSNRKYTLITIVNYNVYQANNSDKSNSKYTVSIQSLDTNNNVNNDNKDIYNKSDSTNPTQPAQNTKADTTTPQELIFRHWNSKNIIQHRKLTDKIKRAINGALQDYSEEEICQAIDNYATILADDRYYWSYKWGLREFLMRGLDKFLDFDIAAQNYRKDEHQQKPSKQTNKWGLREFLMRGLDKFLDFDIAAQNYRKDYREKQKMNKQTDFNKFEQHEYTADELESLFMKI